MVQLSPNNPRYRHKDNCQIKQKGEKVIENIEKGSDGSKAPQGNYQQSIMEIGHGGLDAQGGAV